MTQDFSCGTSCYIWHNLFLKELNKTGKIVLIFATVAFQKLLNNIITLSTNFNDVMPFNNFSKGGRKRSYITLSDLVALQLPELL